MSNRPALSSLPKVDRLAAIPELADFPPAVRTRAARAAVEALRVMALAGEAVTFELAKSKALEEAHASSVPSMRRVVNMSGVVLHTGLGRARLAMDAIEAVSETSQNANLEFDLDAGKRGDRQSHVAGLLRELTGAEDAFVVNNAAAGVFLALAALASGRDVVLSRGQMVEIGGSFRMPDIVRQSGCRLVEVGCTNKTRWDDYEAVVNEATGAILRCHPSNFAVVGFTEEVAPGVLADLAHRKGTILIDDQGSGLLLDTTRFGMPRHPTFQDSVLAGADVVVASGDKLMGGPQAGIVAGRKPFIDTMRKHPLARVVRVGKASLSALEATLRLYRDGREGEIPTWRYLARSLDDVKAMAYCIASAAPEAFVEQGFTEAGSGAPPDVGAPTWRVGLRSQDPDGLLRWLRNRDVPIVGRIERDIVWLDPRTIEEYELEYVIEAFEGMDR